ncbi:MAG: MBL fold metallo-hydrolase [Pseudanabaena sp. ELA645]|jgi:7,8-dihydropterin-6-yl-methyl-4-(beta-D-ribofuranosyl)aminobenzene 5'-phosphate synthase
MKQNRLLAATLTFIVAFVAVLSFSFFAPPEKILAAPSTQNRVVSLYDAFGKRNIRLIKDWGYSSLIEYNGKRILFDGGNNADTFKKNVEALGLDLKTIDFAVLSHPHADHLSGFDYLVSVNPNVKIYLPEDVNTLGASRDFAFGGPDPTAASKLPPEERYFETGVSKAFLTPSGRFYQAKNVQYLSKNLEVAPGITLIATKSPYLGGFNGYPPNSPEKPALAGLPELSLALQTSKGEVVVSGCSHTGIEKIVQATKTALGRNVDTVVGGLHLFPYDKPYIEKLAVQLKDELGVRHVVPTHCTGHLAFGIFRKVFGKEYESGGLGSQITFSS